MKVITIANRKGGIGKTTTATNIAAILNHRGLKTLLIDTDVQCDSTDTFQAKVDGVATLYDLILDDDPCSIEEAIQQTAYGDVIAADPQLEQADEKLSRTPDGSFRLKEAIADLEGYDYVILDTNPSVNTMLFNALVASDEVIIPITADRYAIKGLAQLTNTIARIKKHLNSKLLIGGLVFVRYNDRTTLSRDIKESVEKFAADIGTKVYPVYIRETIKCREAQARKMPLIKYAPKCSAELDYEALVSAILEEVKEEK